MPLKDGKMIINKKMGSVFFSLGLFLIISVLVQKNATMALDESIQRAVFSLHHEFLTNFFKMITYSANWQTILLFCGVFLIMKKTRIKFGVALSFASGISAIFNKSVKLFVARPRPEIEYHLIQQGGFSFPSGHSMTGLVFYGLLVYFIGKYGKENRAQKTLMILLIVLIFLIKKF